VLEYDRPGSGDEALTRQSIGVMFRLSNRDAHSPQLRAAAIAVIGDLGSQPGDKEVADAIFGYVQRTVTYEHEDEMQTPFADFARFLYDQTLIAPAALVSMPRPSGDCVDFSMLAAALCRLFGIPAAYKTIAADPDSRAYSHVYVVAQIAPGQFYPLDCSNGPAPGFEFALPKGKKSKLWPNPEDLRPAAMIRNRRAFVRLGDLTDDPGDSYGAAGTYDLYASDGINPGYTGTQISTDTPVYTPPVATPASSTSGAFTKIATTLINDASAIAAPLIRQSSIQAPYYITGANGAQILYDPSTGKTVNAGAASQLASINSPTTMLIGLAAAVAVVFALSARK
jgi:hypothetical protein